MQVCCQWREIALIMRDSDFKEDEEHLIDIFDVKVRQLSCMLCVIYYLGNQLILSTCEGKRLKIAFFTFNPIPV